MSAYVKTHNSDENQEEQREIRIRRFDFIEDAGGHQKLSMKVMKAMFNFVASNKYFERNLRRS